MILTIIISLLMIDLAWSITIKEVTFYDPKLIKFFKNRIWTISFSTIGIIANFKDEIYLFTLFIFYSALFFYLLSVVVLYIKDKNNGRKI